MPHCNKKMLSFFMTTKCNLCCRYCYNAKERNAVDEQTISIDIAKAAIDWYFQNNSSRHIRFYGPGEPTQEFDIMRQITEYAKAHPLNEDRVTVEIQTNGVFTETVRNWFLENVNIAWMSFDGTRDIQNFNRPLNPKFCEMFHGRTSADVIEHNVKWLIGHNKGKRLMVGARVTITDKNVKRQKELVDYFSGLGIRHVWTNPLFHEVGKIPVCMNPALKDICLLDMDSYVENYLDAYGYAKKKGVFWGSFLTVNFDGESEYHCRCCTPLSAPHITPDGYVSACDMVLLGESPSHMGVFVVGKWDEVTKKFVWDTDKIRELEKRKSSRIGHCKNCPVKLHCGGYCLGETVNETGRLDGQNAVKCAAVRKLYARLGSCEPYEYLHP